jgi:glycerophosphoryl diester phosphodiesterase
LRQAFELLVPHDMLHPQQGLLSAGLVRRIHRQMRTVHAWTVNNPAAMRRHMEWGVNGLMTDRPDLALEEKARLMNG